MPRSFRLLPPEPQPGLLARPRLMRSLVGRWDHRVTVLTGGAGLGKTTVLAQAVTENRLAPRGQDLWIGLEAQDADADGLARIVAAVVAAGHQDRVAAAVGPARSLTATPTPPDPPGTASGGATAATAGAAPTGPAASTTTEAAASITAVAQALWQRAPIEMCLVFDDVHHLATGSEAAGWLADLIGALPANSHVVLAGRAEPPVPLSQFESEGAVLRLTEDQLRFSPDELSGFAARRGVEEGQLADTGGWPALAELTANVDRRLTGIYLWEVVLEPLGERRRHVLAALTDLGGADERLASAALGRPVDLVDTLERVPLIARTADGWHIPHLLWRNAPNLAIDPGERAELRGRAVQHLTGLGRFDDAFRLVEEAGLWDLAPLLLRAACLATDRLISSQLERWLTASPPTVRESGPGCLAAGLLAAATAPTAAPEPLQVAIERCRADGDVDAEMTAIARLARSAWFLQDDALLGDLVARVVELEAATGHPAAAALATVARAALVDLTGDDVAMLAMLESIGPSVLDRSWELLVSFWAAQVRMGMGETEPIHEIVAQLNPDDHPALLGAGRAMELSAWWAEGKVDTALAKIPDMLAAMRAAGVQFNLYLALNGACLVYARCGSIGAARRLLDESIAAAPPSAGGMTARTSMALAYIHLAEGDEEQAAAVLRAAIEAHGLEQGIDRDTWRQHIALSYVLLPETREHWDGRTLHGHLHTARRLAQALVAVRHGQAMTLSSFDLPPTGVVRSALDVRFAAELAVGLGAAGRTDDGGTLLEALGSPGRAALRDLATAGSRAKPAKALLAAVPAAPPRPTYVAVLGPTTLRREGPDSEAAVDTDLRRTKPQALLGYLILHRVTTRAAVAAALWPELDERAAANNLAVTLNHLLRVLEPWRHSGEPPYLLRLDGRTVRLVTGDHLRIDLDDFEHHVAAAAKAESDGVPSQVLENDLSAVELYRGDLFADLADAEWLSLDREHHRIRFVDAAVRAGELLLGRGDPDAAEKVAHRALAVDRWAEQAYAVLIGAAMARRDRSGAQRMLRHCIDALDELGAQPSQATRQLRRRVLGVAV